jgi:hypothetical protein
MATKPVSKKDMPCNKPKRTPSHPKKSHVVKACENGKEKVIRFGEQGAKTAGKPKAGESEAMKKKRASLRLVTVKILQKAKCQRLIGQIKQNGNEIQHDIPRRPVD